MSDPSLASPRPSAWNVANALTVFRVLLVPLFGWLLLRENGTDTLSRFAALAVFSIAIVSDRLDGELARRRGLVTDFGKIADPIADKALIGMAFIALSLLGELPWWVTAVVLAREAGVTLLRFVVIKRGVIAASVGGKLKTALQAMALGLYILALPPALHPVAVIVMVAAVIVTLATGVDYVQRARRLWRQGGS